MLLHVSLLIFCNSIFWRKWLSVFFWWIQESWFSFNLFPFTWRRLLSALGQSLMLFRHLVHLGWVKPEASVSQTSCACNLEFHHFWFLCCSWGLSCVCHSQQWVHNLHRSSSVVPEHQEGKSCKSWLFLIYCACRFNLKRALVAEQFLLSEMCHKEEGKGHWSQPALKIGPVLGDPVCGYKSTPEFSLRAEVG